MQSTLSVGGDVLTLF